MVDFGFGGIEPSGSTTRGSDCVLQLKRVVESVENPATFPLKVHS